MTPQDHQLCKQCGKRLIRFNGPEGPLVCPKCMGLEEQVTPPAHESIPLGHRTATEPSVSPLAKETKNVGAFREIAPNLERKKALISQSFHKDSVDVEQVKMPQDLKDFYKLQNTKIRPLITLRPFHYLLVALFCILGCIGYLLWERHQNKIDQVSEIQTLEEKLRSQADYSNAKKFAEEFLSCQSYQEAIALCLPDKGLETSMKSYWEAYSLDGADLQYIGMSYLPSDFIVYRFHLILGEESRRQVLVFRSEGNAYYFDWRSFAGIHELDLRESLSLEEGEVFIVRAKVETNAYYNFGYQEDHWDSFKLSHPNYSRASHLKINAFSSPDVSEDLFKYYDKGLRPLLLKLEKRAHCVEIVEMVSDLPEIYHFNEYAIPFLNGAPDMAPSPLSTDLPFSIYDN